MKIEGQLFNNKSQQHYALEILQILTDKLRTHIMMYMAQLMEIWVVQQEQPMIQFSIFITLTLTIYMHTGKNFKTFEGYQELKVGKLHE